MFLGLGFSWLSKLLCFLFLLCVGGGGGVQCKMAADICTAYPMWDHNSDDLPYRLASGKDCGNRCRFRVKIFKENHMQK